MIRNACIDWGGTLMSEDGPQDVPMAQWPAVRVLDGARELLATLSRSKKIWIATNATVSRRADVELALARGGLLEFISGVFCFIEIGAKKSTPQFWETVTRQLACAPSNIAMLGDSLEEDVLGPARAGIFSVWFNPASLPAPAGVRSVSRLADFLDAVR